MQPLAIVGALAIIKFFDVGLGLVELECSTKGIEQNKKLELDKLSLPLKKVYAHEFLLSSVFKNAIVTLLWNKLIS